jgi:hypothetical protein
MNATLIRRAFVVLSIAFSLCGDALAQNDVLSSAAGSALGVKSGPSCEITIYSKQSGCPRCDQIRGNDREGCPRIKTVYGLPASHSCSMYPIIAYPGGMACDGNPGSDLQTAISYCKKVCEEKPRDPKPPTDPRPEPPTQPDPPSPPTGRCTGQAKIECPNATGYACCLVGCDKTSSNGCVKCPAYRPCEPSSCKAGETCVNKKDAKGCPQNFTCEGSTPPNGSCPEQCPPGSVCVDGVCSVGPPGEPPVEPQPCDSPSDCPPGMTCENGQCTIDGNPPVDPPPACTDGNCDPADPPQPPTGRCPRAGEPSYLTKECSNSAGARTCCREEESCGADGATCTPKGSGGGNGGSVCIGGRCGF